MLPGLVAALLTLAAAVLVFVTSPGRTINRMAGLVLLVDAIHITTSGMVSVAVVADTSSMRAVLALHFMIDAAQIVLYLAFIGVALRTPLVRPFRDRRVLAALWLLVLPYVGLLLVRPEIAIQTLAPVDHWYFTQLIVQRWPVNVVFIVGAVAFFYALAAAIHAWRRAPSAEARRQAGAFAIAFGVRDLTWGVAFGSIILYGASGPPSADTLAWSFLRSAFLLALFPLVLAYGILKTQLFDIDLRLKWTISRGAVAGMFVAAFFVVSEGAQQLFAGAVGPVLGLAAAGVLVFALAPLQRFADRLSDRAMPNVRDTNEYRMVRKHEVYRAAVEGAAQDGAITDRERDILARLQDELGLTGTDARMIERDATAKARAVT